MSLKAPHCELALDTNLLFRNYLICLVLHFNGLLNLNIWVLSGNMELILESIFIEIKLNFSDRSMRFLLN